MAKYLFFDTETTGVDRNGDRIVQISWILTDEQDNELSVESYIIRPDGYEIPARVSAIHGITTERATEEGLPLEEVMSAFEFDWNRADAIVAHNIGFDLSFVRREAENAGITLKEKSVWFDTMEAGTDVCKLPGRYHGSGYSPYKSPKLIELYRHLFRKGFEDAHTASADTQACRECFWELARRDVITLI